MPPEIAVIGAGTMGAGIAQLALEHGHRVRLIDLDPGATARGQAAIRDRIARRLARSGLAGGPLEAALDELLGRLAIGKDLEPAAGATFVIEAVVESLRVKQALFEQLDRVTAGDAILASNTSALSIGSIAHAAAGHPERVLGLHFFNPAPIMPLVEVVAGPLTTATVVEAAAGLVGSWQRTPIRCADRPGFVVNRVNRPFTIQALRCLEAGRASVATIDAAIRDQGFPLGPFELMDLIGIDINLAVATAIWEGLDRSPRFQPSSIQAGLVAAGRLGRKSGEGFYRYDEGGAKAGPAPQFEDGTQATHDPGPPGSIADRIRLAIANEAFRALDAGVAADEATIDLALRLGANHPDGPFAWARSRGLSEVIAGLQGFDALDPGAFEPARGLLEAAGRQ